LISQLRAWFRIAINCQETTTMIRQSHRRPASVRRQKVKSGQRKLLLERLERRELLAADVLWRDNLSLNTVIDQSGQSAWADPSNATNTENLALGQSYQADLYEFWSPGDSYAAEADIVSYQSASDNDFFYFSFTQRAPLTGNESTVFHIEIDADFDEPLGDIRSDYFIRYSPSNNDVSATWRNANLISVEVYRDADDTVGGSNLTAPDNGDDNGYETEVLYDKANDLFARIVDGRVEIAVRRSVLDQTSESDIRSRGWTKQSSNIDKGQLFWHDHQDPSALSGFRLDNTHSADTDTWLTSNPQPSVIKPLYLTTDGIDGDTTGWLDRIDPVATSDLTTSETATLDTGVAAGVVHMATTTGSSQTGDVTVSHTTGSDANRLMLVGISWKPDSNQNITSVTYGGVGLTQLGHVLGNDHRVAIYYLVNPASVTANVVVDFASGHKGAFVGVSTYSGVDQTTPLGTFNSATGDSTTASVNIASAPNDLVFDTVTKEKNGDLIVGANQIQRWNSNANVNEVRGAGSTELATAASTTMSWTLTAQKKWVIAGVAIKPAAGGGGGTSTATFTQAPGMTSEFHMPSGAPINVITYVNVITGTMPVNPNVTATLKYNSTAITTLTNPTYDNIDGTLTWTTNLGSAVTVPAGEAIMLEVTNAQSGVSFRIQYDSETKPSRVDLPTSTYIAVDSLDVYDTQFSDDGDDTNDGSIITSAFTGSTVYVRAVVSDPFGKYDITSLLMDINPVPGVVVPTRYDIDTAANQVVYEYAWDTGSLGTFDITVVANEGFEGDVFDTAETEFEVLEADAPSIALVKTGELDMTVVPPNDRVDEGDEITYTFTITNTGNVTLDNVTLNDALLGLVNVVLDGNNVTGDNGNDVLDVNETWTFTATYTLTQPDIDAGEVRNQALVTATDPNEVEVSDESDFESPSEDRETVVVLQQEPSIALVKTGELDMTVVAPNDRVDEGDEITYTFTITNTGNVTLDNVTLNDALLGLVDVVLDGNNVTGDNGNDVLDVDETWTFTATYTLTQPDIDAGEVSNQALVTATDPNEQEVSDESDFESPSEDRETVVVLQQEPSIALVKTGALNLAVVAPNDQADVGDQITYTFTITNTGNVTLENIALDDAKLGLVNVALPAPGMTGDQNNDGRLDVGEVWIYTVVYTLTAADIQAGSVVNNATVTGSFGEVSSEDEDGDTQDLPDPSDIIVIGPDKTKNSLPYVHVYDAASNTLLHRFLGLPLTPNYRGGVRIATGDLDGDGIDEIITAPGRNAVPLVYIFKLVDGQWVEQSSFLAFDAKFKGGVNLAIGNVDGDAFPNGAPKNDIVASMSYGGNEVRVFLNTTASPISFAEDRGSFERFQPYGKLKGGATVRVADMGTMSAGGLDQTSLDGSAEIIVGNGAGLRSTVKVYGYNVAGNNPVAVPVKQFLPFEAKFRGGISLDLARVNDDLVPDILVGTGNRGGSRVTVLDGKTGTPLIAPFSAFPKAEFKTSFNAPVGVTFLVNSPQERATHFLVYQGTDGRAGKMRKFDLNADLVDELMAKTVDKRGFDEDGDFLNAYFASTLKSRSGPNGGDPD
jgi:uncharacterized repeat protein (TIGR01451 family)